MTHPAASTFPSVEKAQHRPLAREATAWGAFSSRFQMRTSLRTQIPQLGSLQGSTGLHSTRCLKSAKHFHSAVFFTMFPQAKGTADQPIKRAGTGHTTATCRRQVKSMRPSSIQVRGRLSTCGLWLEKRKMQHRVSLNYTGKCTSSNEPFLALTCHPQRWRGGARRDRKPRSAPSGRWPRLQK